MHSEVGNLLLEAGILDEDGLQQVLGSLVQYGGNFVQNLVRLGLVEEERLVAFLSRRLGLSRVEDNQLDNLPAFLTRMVTADLVLAHRLVPVMLHEGQLYLAMSDPTDRVGLEEVAFATGYRTRPVVAGDTIIQQAMARYYGIPPESNPLLVATAPAYEQADRQEQQRHQGGEVFTSGPPPTLAEGTQSASLQEPSTSGQASATGQATDRTADQPEQLLEKRRRQRKREAGEDLEELFANQRGDKQQEVVPLTRKKETSQAASSISEALLEHTGITEPEDILVLTAPKKQGKPPPAAGRSEPEPSGDAHFSAAAEPAAIAHQPAEPQTTAEHKPATAPEAAVTAQPSSQRQSPADEITSPPETAAGGEDEEPVPLIVDSESLRQALEQARERDEIARLLVGFALTFMPRVVLFVVRRELLVGWLGAGHDMNTAQVKGIMVPLNAPSVFKTVYDTQTDYFGSLPRTTINDVFIAALGPVRPSRVLLIPVSVHHKPVAILYGDCGSRSGFDHDLSPLHLAMYDVARAFEKLILEKKKSGRRIIR